MSSRTEKLRQINFYDELVKLRDQQREIHNNGLILIKGSEIPSELNPQGQMQWYMHPSMDDICMHSLIIYVQEIPPGSRSGKIFCQGGQVIYIWEGRGYTVIDGVSHAWEGEDVLQIPLRIHGCTFQHFNSDPDHPCRLIVTEANLTGPLGVDRGVGWEQREPSPDYLRAKKESR